MRGEHFTHLGRHSVLIYGKLNKQGTTMGFAFVYDDSYCLVHFQQEFEKVTYGFKEVYTGIPNKLVLLGYGDAGDDDTNEFLVFLHLNPALNANKDIQMERKFTQISYWTDSIAINGGIFGTTHTDGTVNHIAVVYPERICTTSEDGLEQFEVWKFSEGINSALATLPNYWALLAKEPEDGYIMLLLYSKSNIFFAEEMTSESNLLIDLWIDTGSLPSMKNFKMSMVEDAQNNQLVIDWVYLKNGQGLQFTKFVYNIADSTLVSLTREYIAHPLQPMHLSRNAAVLTCIALNNMNELQVMSITAGAITNQQSAPLDYVSNEAAALLRLSPSPNNWDIWYFGTTSQMTLDNETFSFPRQIGFAMALNKNRLSALFQTKPFDTATSNVETLTQEDDVLIDGPLELDNEEGEYYEFSADAPYDHVTLSVEKNEWKDDVAACASNPVIENLAATCSYYHIFDLPLNIVHVDFKGDLAANKIPLYASACDTSQIFHFENYGLMAAGNKSIRNTCFPQYTEKNNPLAVPVDGLGYPLVYIDRMKQQIYWPNVLSSDLSGSSWKTELSEKTDDQKTDGINASAEFKVNQVKNLDITVKSDTPISHNFLDPDTVDDFSVSVHCWSVACNPYVKQGSYSFFTELGSNQKLINETFVYYIELDQISKSNFTAVTWTFQLAEQILSSATSMLNITDDFEEWYEENQDQLPFYVDKSRLKYDDYDDENYYDEEYYDEEDPSGERMKRVRTPGEKSNLMKDLDRSVQKDIMTWSDSDILIALQEAKERLTRPETENFPSSKIDQKGNLGINFQNKVNFPTYLKKQITEEVDKYEAENNAVPEGDQQVLRRQRRDRRLGMFDFTQFAPDATDVKVAASGVTGVPLKAGDSGVIFEDPCLNKFLMCQAGLEQGYPYEYDAEFAAQQNQYGSEYVIEICEPIRDTCETVYKDCWNVFCDYDDEDNYYCEYLTSEEADKIYGLYSEDDNNYGYGQYGGYYDNGGQNGYGDYYGFDLYGGQQNYGDIFGLGNNYGYDSYGGQYGYGDYFSDGGYQNSYYMDDWNSYQGDYYGDYQGDDYSGYFGDIWADYQNDYYGYQYDGGYQNDYYGYQYDGGYQNDYYGYQYDGGYQNDYYGYQYDGGYYDDYYYGENYLEFWDDYQNDYYDDQFDTSVEGYDKQDEIDGDPYDMVSEGYDCPLTDPSCNPGLVTVGCNPNDPGCIDYSVLNTGESSQTMQQSTSGRISSSANSQSSSSSSRQELRKPKPKTCKSHEYLDEKTNKCVDLVFFFGNFKDLFKVVVNTADESSPTARRLSDIPVKIAGFSDKQIDIKLEFSDPIAVSPEDMLEIETNFGGFEQGVKQAKTKIPCTRQVVEGTATKSVESMAVGSQAAAIGAAIGSGIVQMVLSASLAQLWGMINGLQFILHTPTLNVEMPGNGFLILKQIITVATFDLPYVTVEDVTFGNYPVVEGEVLDDMPKNVKASMMQLGYDSPNISGTMGSIYVITLITLTCFVLIILSSSFFAIPFGWTKRLNTWLKNQFMWNFTIRLIFEGTLESVYSIGMYYYYGTFNKNMYGSVIDFWVCIVFAAAIFLIPFFMLIFYSINRKRWADADFDDTYGAPIDGLKKQSRWSLFFPIYFVVRRITFAVVSFTLFQYPLIQLAVHWFLCNLAFGYLATFCPYEDYLTMKLDMLNEVVTILIIDLCFLFTPVVPNAAIQYQIGYWFVAIVLLTISIHVYFLLRDTFSSVSLRLKVWCTKVKRQGVCNYVFSVGIPAEGATVQQKSHRFQAFFNFLKSICMAVKEAADDSEEESMEEESEESSQSSEGIVKLRSIFTADQNINFSDSHEDKDWNMCYHIDQLLADVPCPNRPSEIQEHTTSQLLRPNPWNQQINSNESAEKPKKNQVLQFELERDFAIEIESLDSNQDQPDESIRSEEIDRQYTEAVFRSMRKRIQDPNEQLKFSPEALKFKDLKVKDLKVDYNLSEKDLTSQYDTISQTSGREKYSENDCTERKTKKKMQPKKMFSEAGTNIMGLFRGKKADTILDIDQQQSTFDD